MNEQMEGQKPTAIDVNLKLPNETQDELSLGDIIRFLWAGKKTLIICTLIGVALGLGAAGIYYMANKPVSNGGVASATIKYLYPQAAANKAPDDTPLDHTQLFSLKVIDPAVEALTGSGVDEADVRFGLAYENLFQADGKTVDYTRLKISFDMDNDMANRKLDGKAIMGAVLASYRSWFSERYSVLALKTIQAKQNIRGTVTTTATNWDGLFMPNLNWDLLEYAQAFAAAAERLETLMPCVYDLYLANPAVTYNEKGYADLYNSINAVLTEDVYTWTDKLAKKPYVRDADKFKAVTLEDLAVLEQQRDDLNFKLERYAALLSSISGSEVINIDTANSRLVTYFNNLIACEDEINRINLSLESLVTGANARNIAEAEKALADILEKIDGIQESGRELLVAAADEPFVILEGPTYTALYSGAVSKTRLLLLFMGLAAVGFAAGLVVLIGKKYI